MVTQQFTDVTDVVSTSIPIVIFVGRTRHYIERDDELTFVGDSHPDLLENGRRYRLVSGDVDNVYLDDVEDHVTHSLYREDMRYYLENGGFIVHDA